jgi:hypothetical protein
MVSHYLEEELFQTSMQVERKGMVNQACNYCTTRFHRCQKFKVQNAGANSKCFIFANNL